MPLRAVSRPLHNRKKSVDVFLGLIHQSTLLVVLGLLLVFLLLPANPQGARFDR